MLSILSFLSWKNSGNGSERKLSAKAASDTIMAERQKLIGPAVAVFYPADPLVVTKAHRQYLFDQEGTRFLDCISNVQHVGHAHEEVAAAVSQQMRETTANSRFLHPSLTRVATKILNTLPSEVNNLYMCNSGSEANDLALRLAGDFTGGATEVIVVDQFHFYLALILYTTH